MRRLTFWCDDSRHLVCVPYSVENLHRMAARLKLKRCWFHKNHYDIPLRRRKEIEAKCWMVTRQCIVAAILGQYNNSFHDLR